MFSAIRKHISPTTIVAFMALVFAMTGGAFAASSGSGGGSAGVKATASVSPLASAAKSKAKPKAKAGPRGPAGPKGATGATGAPGATGPGGPAGATGPGGPQGAPGANGTNGTNGEPGKEGKEGPAGPEGTFGGQTLPSGKTLTGHWAGSGFGEEKFGGTGGGLVGQAWASVSFALPLEVAPTATHYIDAEEVERKEIPSGCAGNAEEPGAEPGNLCVFAETELNVFARSFVPSAPKSGFTVRGLTAGKGSIVLAGTWAVTAE